MTPARSSATSPKTKRYAIAMGLWKKVEVHLHTSNASSGWGGSDYAAHAVKMTNLFPPHQPETPANLQKSFLRRSKCKKPAYNGVRVLKNDAALAPATTCFSIEPAQSCHPPHCRYFAAKAWWDFSSASTRPLRNPSAVTSINALPSSSCNVNGCGSIFSNSRKLFPPPCFSTFAAR